MAKSSRWSRCTTYCGRKLPSPREAVQRSWESDRILDKCIQLTLEVARLLALKTAHCIKLQISIWQRMRIMGLRGRLLAGATLSAFGLILFEGEASREPFRPYEMNPI